LVVVVDDVFKLLEGDEEELFVALFPILLLLLLKVDRLFFTEIAGELFVLKLFAFDSIVMFKFLSTRSCGSPIEPAPAEPLPLPPEVLPDVMILSASELESDPENLKPSGAGWYGGCAPRSTLNSPRSMAPTSSDEVITSPVSGPLSSN
jgi:hypothetical protein